LKDADATWENTRVIRGDVRRAVERLKRDIAGDILIAGSAKLVQGLTEYGLVDQYRLMTFPVVLGTGKRLFEGGVSKKKLRVVDNKPVGKDGVVILTYEPVRV
jgi:dihydrofolate reductase